jgi:hypothetical protein
MNSWLMSARRVTFLAAVAVVFCVSVAHGDPPTGWFAAGSDPTSYDFRTDAVEKHAGKASASLQSKDTAADGFGTLMQMFRADDYRGQRVRMTGWVKAKEVEGWAGLWMRVDGAEKSSLAFDNMQQRAIKGTAEWKQYALVLDVPDSGVAISFGVLLAGKGQVWVDDFHFEKVDNTVPVTDMKVTPGDNKTTVREETPKRPANLDFEKE